MTTIDIDAIREREQAATPGPWHTWTVDPRPRFQVGTTTPFRPVAEVYERDERGNDAEFIAHARSDVPALCDEIEQLRAELADVAAAIAPTVTISPAPAAARFLHSLYQDWVKTAHERLEQVDKLTAELAAADQQIASMRAAIDEADEAEAAR